MNPFSPSNTREPVLFGADPRGYHKIGKEFKRGDQQFIMSRSELARFGRCPERWLHLPEEPKTPAMEWGSLLDCIVLTPELFPAQYSVTPEQYKNDKGEMKDWNWNATACKEWRQREHASGKEVAKLDHASAAWRAAKRFTADPIIARFLEVSKRQVQVFVNYCDPETRIVVPVKCMVDLLPDPDSEYGECIGDFKTTDNAEPGAWERTAASMGYATQAAMYLDAVNAALGAEYWRFIHLIQESEEPYQPARREIWNDWIELGRVEYVKRLQQYCRCLSTGRFPGYDDADSFVEPAAEHGFRVAFPPAWLLRQMQS